MTRKTKFRTRPQLEGLEPRALLAAPSLQPIDTTGGLGGGTVVVINGADDPKHGDNVRVTIDGDKVVVSETSKGERYEFPRKGITDIEFFGQSGDDDFEVTSQEALILKSDPDVERWLWFRTKGITFCGHRLREVQELTTAKKGRQGGGK